MYKDGEVCSTCTEISYNSTSGEFVFSVTGFSTYTTQETPYCGDGNCDSGENCPADADVCTDNVCYDPTCTNGCGQDPITIAEDF